MGIAERWAGHPPLPEDLAERLPRVVERLVRGGARLVYLFGSAARSSGPAEPADLDLAVLGLEEDRWAVGADVAEILGTDRLDLVMLEEAGPDLRHRIVADGRVLHAADPRVERDLVRAGYIRSGRGPARSVRERRSVERRLAELAEVLAKLRAQAGEEAFGAERLAEDLRRRWSVERGLLAASNLIFDVADHIAAGHFSTHPATYEESLRLLAREDVLAEETYERLRGLGGFRNVLAHEYVDIDLDEVVRWRGRMLDAVPELIAQVESWLECESRLE